MISNKELDALISEKIMRDKNWVCSHSESNDDWGIYKDSFDIRFVTKAEAEEFAKLHPRKKSQPSWYNGPSIFPYQSLKRYSSDIGYAMDVVKKIGQVWNGFEFLLRWNGYADVWEAGWVEYDNSGFEGRAFARGHNPAFAICLAALETIK